MVSGLVSGAAAATLGAVTSLTGAGAGGIVLVGTVAGVATGGTVAGGTVAVGGAVTGGTVAVGTVAGGTVAAADLAGGTGAGGTVAGGTVAAPELAAGSAAGAIVGVAPMAGEAVPGGNVLAASSPEADPAGVAVAAAAGFHSEGVGPAGRSGSRESDSPNADGGHAGIVCSVGGSGGQMSLWVGRGASGCAFGGHVKGADRAGGEVGLGSGSPAESAGAGEVCAHEGAGFCMGTGGLGSVSSATAGASSAGGLV
jgi:hypothetical protein